MSGCVRQTTKKYLNRNSPSYPANECCRRHLQGNDGKVYFSSKVGSQKSCTWKLINPKSPKRSVKKLRSNRSRRKSMSLRRRN